MKLFSVIILCAAPAFAQEKVTVPLSSPNQPVTVKVHRISGSISVVAGTNGSQVVVESTRTPREPRAARDAPAGMHRIDVARGGLEVEEDHNQIVIGGGDPAAMDSLRIEVPVNTSVQLKVINGKFIDVTGINGEIDVDITNGAIALKNVSGSVIAHALNGNITATLDKVDPDKPMSFSSLNGKIEVTLPQATKARLRLKTENGTVYSDFDVKMEADTSKPVLEESGGAGGKYRIKMDRSVYGSINGGGPEYRFENMNGSILIHRK